MLFGCLYRLFRQSLVSAAVSVHCTDVKGKRFSGGNTLCLQRKIPPETVQPPDLFTFKEVCTNFNGRARKYATDGICIWSIRILVVLLPLSVVYVFNIIAIPVPFRNFILGLNARTDSFYILINFLAGQL